jgi:tetratricopeptide (TPR) repeat protein
MAQFKDAEGWYYLQTGKISESLEYFLAALKLAEECAQPRPTANILKDIGGAYLQLGMFDQAVESLLQSIKLYREIGDLKALKAEIKAQSNLSAVYMNSGHHQNAIDACLRVITLVDSLKSTDFTSKANALGNLGYLYSVTDKPREAIRSYHEALQLEKQSNNLLLYYNTLQNMAFFLPRTR